MLVQVGRILGAVSDAPANAPVRIGASGFWVGIASAVIFPFAANGRRMLNDGPPGSAYRSTA